MAVHYVKGACFDPDLADPKAGEEKKSLQSFEPPQTSPVLDASAYVSAVVPIPDGSGFLMSRLFENPNVIALDFRNASHMSDTLDRISNFVENNAKKKIDTADDVKRLLAEKGLPCGDNDDICGLGEGHDLKMQDIADFYNRSFDTGMELTSGEGALLSALKSDGHLVMDGSGHYHPVSSEAMIGMSRSYGLADRREAFVHEYSHALFFLDPVFHSKVAGVWSSLKLDERRFLTGALIASGDYGSGDRELMQTEAQAYAIAPVLGEDGFVGPLRRARNNCDSTGAAPRRCGDFFSYTGNIRTLLDKIHDKYRNISRCQIPFLEDWRSSNEMIVPADVSNDCTGQEEPKHSKTSNGELKKELQKIIDSVLPGLVLDPKVLRNIPVAQSTLEEISTAIFRRGLPIAQFNREETYVAGFGRSGELLLENLQTSFDSLHRKRNKN